MASVETARQARGVARCGASRKAGNAANVRRKPPLKGPGLLGLGCVEVIDRSPATLCKPLLPQAQKTSDIMLLYQPERLSDQE